MCKGTHLGITCFYIIYATLIYAYINAVLLVNVLAVSPSIKCYSETLSTLRYAQQAKCIVNKPVVNEVGIIFAVC